MSRLLRHVFLFTLCLGCPGFLSDAFSQTQNPKKPRAASVSGRVTLHGKGAGGIVVGVRSSDFSMSPAGRSTTDNDGNYRITEIQPGRYQVALLSSAYTFSSEDLTGTRTKNLLLEEGEDVSGIDFSVIRGGVITGRITDADGRPVIEERIILFSEQTNQANPNQKFQIFNPNNATSMQTDDRGIYRIYALPPGRYKIAAGMAENNYASFGGRRATYKQTFFPDAGKADDATIIELAEDAEARNIDITLGRSLPGFVASGKIVDRETGQPVAGVRLAARRTVSNNQSSSLGFPALSDSEGSFRLDSLTPGKYSIVIVPQPGIEVRADSPVPFEVIDQNVTGLLVQAAKGLVVTGAVVLDGDYDQNVFAKLAQLRLSAYVRSSTPNPVFGRDTTLSSDGAFRIGGLSPGTLNFSISQPDRREAVGFTILRVERDGVVQPRGVELKDEQVSGVKIVVSYGTGSVRGELKFENGSLPANGRAVVSLRRPSAPGGFRQYSPDLRGHFLIEGIRAGTYDLYVNVFLGEGRPLVTKQPVTVSEGAASDVVVSVDLKPNPEPTPQ
jgi:protocatechuate 3,4-dioxygenase beta subunit